MENVKVCAGCGAPYVGTSCPNCGSSTESGTEKDTDDCAVGTSSCSNCGCIVGNGTSGRMVSAPTPWKGILDVPKCPWCGELMAVELRQNLEGKYIAYCHCVICKAKAPTVMAEISTADLIEMAKMVVNCRFIDPNGQTTNGDRIRRIGMMPDEELAPLLWRCIYEGIDDKLRFCTDNPECEEIVEQDGGVPEEMCMQCLIKWLGALAKEQKIATPPVAARNDKEEVCKD